MRIYGPIKQKVLTVRRYFVREWQREVQGIRQGKGTQGGILNVAIVDVGTQEMEII